MTIAEGFYVLAGFIGVLVYGRALYRRVLGWQQHRDRRSQREVIEALAFTFVAFQILALTVAGIIGIPRVWLVVGAAAAAGAFVAAGVVFDQEDTSDRP